MAKYIIFENKKPSFMTGAEKLTVIKVGLAPDALIFGPLWAFRHNLLPQFVLGLIVMFGVDYFLGGVSGFIAWFIFGLLYFFGGNGIKVESFKENKSYKFLDEIEANGLEEAKSKYHSKRKEAEYAEAKEKRDAAKELKEQEELDKVKQSGDTKDYIEKLKEARMLLVDGAITLEEYEKLKQKIMSEI